MKCRIPGYMKILKCRVLRLAGFFLLIHGQAFAQQLPTDVSTVVNGYQDDFDGSSLNPNWLVAGEDVYSVAGGMLHIRSANGDPNHLLYAVSGYDDTIQEVLARIRVVTFGSGDGPRGGVAVGVDPGSSQGINLHFRDNGGRSMSYLDDLRSWGQEPGFRLATGRLVLAADSPGTRGCVARRQRRRLRQNLAGRWH